MRHELKVEGKTLIENNRKCEHENRREALDHFFRRASALLDAFQNLDYSQMSNEVFHFEIKE